MAERERGRKRLAATTTAVSFASVAAAGVVALLLPGSTHASVSTGSAGTKSSGSSHGSAGSSSSSNNSNSSNNSSSSSNSGNLQAPTSAPTQSSGTPVSTSGGTSW